MRKTFPAKPDPEALEQRVVGGERDPAENRESGDGDVQQPVKRREPEGEPGNETKAEALPAHAAERRREHQARSNPRESGDAEIGKRRREQQPRNDGERVAQAGKGS